MNRCFRRFASTRREILSNGPGLADFIHPSTSIETTQTNSQMSISSQYQYKLPTNFYMETYGCQMNSSDSEIVRSILLEKGFLEVDSYQNANVILVNTCAIRENAESRVWTRLREFRSFKKKQAIQPVVGLLGCMAERLKGKLLDPKEKLVNLVVGPDAYRDLPNLIDIVQDTENSTDDAVNVQLSLEETYADITPVRSNPNSPSAYVSIMRGCNNMCSYCIVPFTRGRERSQALSSVVDQVARLRDDGVKEVVLLGQNVNSYHDRFSATAQEHGRGYASAAGFSNMYKSRNQKGFRFADLLDQCADVDPEIRIRFTSPHPKDFPDEVLQVIRDRHNICKSIHMPAQSGNTDVLQRMRRGYSREAYLQLVEHIRDTIPNVALSSDFITGFCGETEAEHQDTVTLMEQVVFDQAFMFAYSLRDRTHAAHRMEDNVPEQIKLRRLQEIIDTFGRCVEDKNTREEVGRYHVVLVEGNSRRSTETSPELSGLSDTNKRCIFPDINVPTSVQSVLAKENSFGKINRGDYVLVRVDTAGRQTLKTTPVAKTTLSEMKALSNEEQSQLIAF